MMRAVISFLAGIAVGALLMSYLGERRETPAPERAAASAPAPRPLAPKPVGVPAPPSGEEIEPPEATATAPARVALPATPLSDRSLAIPVAGVARGALRDHFDDPRGGRAHHAIDIAAPRRTPVLAADDGTIARLFLSRAGGITIYQFDPQERWVYYYAHLDGYAPRLEEGKRVRRGEVIGYVGTSGNAPANVPHLHFAIERLPPTKEWWKGEAVNPYPLLMARGVTFE